MKKAQSEIILSATDLVTHLNCGRATALDLSVLNGALEKPDYYDPLLEILRERGARHEAAFVEHLKSQGLDVVRIEGVDITDDAVAATIDAMRAGAQIIIQAALYHNGWAGRADVLRRVERPSDLGAWSYEIMDTKLARETKGGTILQLCLYADLLTAAQGLEPEFVYVVAPWSDFEPQWFRVADYGAYFRRAKRIAEEAIRTEARDAPYPDPKSHCDICRWQRECDARRRSDDHLCLTAGISKRQIAELHSRGVTTLKALTKISVPLDWTPARGSKAALEKVQRQAAIQVAAREAGALKFELLDIVEEAGLAALPEPSAGDIFLDLESDPFVGEEGLEYLFGWAFRNDDGEWAYDHRWAFNRQFEKEAFEAFVDFALAQRKAYPDMHVYHYAPYEPAALKRLMGRYATREDEIDNFLRGLVFIDLFSAVRHAVRASVESYSLKQLEPFYGFERKIVLRDANIALTRIASGLELDDVASIEDETKAVVAGYNEDDCRSAVALRQWLEELRAQAIADGAAIPRPAPGQDGPGKELDERQQRVAALIARLTDDVPVDQEARSAQQHARWILAHSLDWHRREKKATWWEFFRLSDLQPEDFLQERTAIGGLSLLGEVDQTKTGIPTHRYAFEPQDTDVREDDELRAAGGDKLGKVAGISAESGTIDIKKMKATADMHPPGVFSFLDIRTPDHEASLFRLGEHVADNGIEGNGPLKAARALLLRESPDRGGAPLRKEGETPLEAALRLCHSLKPGVLPIQGPPGTGKSFTGARMICELVALGKKVGITANSHKVIRKLLDKVIEAADERELDLQCAQKPKTGETEPEGPRLQYAWSNEDLLAAIAGNADVAGATHFFWTREDAIGSVDVLFVDEAAQMSLANVLAIAPAAETLVLLGDPRQLDQPTQGSHPDGIGVSALDHVLAGKQTIGADQGLFLEKTWRLHPKITEFNSELFYEGKLDSVEGCEKQLVQSSGAISGAGLFYLPVAHVGNTSASIEEAETVARLIRTILDSGSVWTDRKGKTAPIRLEDILVITPYNAQVFEIQKRVPGARVGTVDKFQGQEAPIAIYSMATSSHADAPRGMEFLYSSNRFNVAISRAQCMAIVVTAPDVFEAECRTPQQMTLANAFCRYLEMAKSLEL